MSTMDVMYLVRWDVIDKGGASLDHVSLFEIFDEAVERAAETNGRVYQVDEGDLVNDFRERQCHHTHPHVPMGRCIRDEDHEGIHLITFPSDATPRKWQTGDAYLNYAVTTEIIEALEEQDEREGT